MNWQTIVAELREGGMTQQQIADFCKCRQPAIQALGSGKTTDPSWSLGDALVRLRDARRAGLAAMQAAMNAAMNQDSVEKPPALNGGEPVKAGAGAIPGLDAKQAAA